MSISNSLMESDVAFATADGTIDGFFVQSGDEPRPALILWPDIASVRESKRDMARRLAGDGYAVLVLNPYYRDVAAPQFVDFADFIAQEGFSKVALWRAKHDADAIGRDAEAAVAWLDAQPGVDTTRGIGTSGYCMGGRFAVWSAAAVPGRIKAAASFHGGGLVGDDDKSPHKVLAHTDASFLIAVAKDDDAKAPEDKTTFAAAAADAGRPAVVTVYEGNHGWTVPVAPSYDQPAAEAAHADLLNFYSAHL